MMQLQATTCPLHWGPAAATTAPAASPCHARACRPNSALLLTAAAPPACCCCRSGALELLKHLVVRPGEHALVLEVAVAHPVHLQGGGGVGAQLGGLRLSRLAGPGQLACTSPLRAAHHNSTTQPAPKQKHKAGPAAAPSRSHTPHQPQRPSRPPAAQPMTPCPAPPPRRACARRGRAGSSRCSRTKAGWAAPAPWAGCPGRWCRCLRRPAGGRARRGEQRPAGGASAAPAAQPRQRNALPGTLHPPLQPPASSCPTPAPRRGTHRSCAV
jgi:hypothetical protein